MDEQELIGRDIHAYLAAHEQKELLRFCVVGSVDDGKSSLIGKLLYDSGNIYEDHLAAIKKASKMEGAEIDLSLLTDGLKAEREQGITIDVAYRYFTTKVRKFIIADTPGHVQYTRNMVTGASTANVAVILVDARLGVLEQSRRHAYIASMLGIPHLLVAVNKMDLKGYAEGVYRQISADFAAFAGKLGFKDVTYVPISAVKGDNVVQPGANTKWYDGPTVLSFLESVPIAQDRNLRDFRFPVQYVLRPNLNYRGFAGQVASGVVKKGDPVMVLPSGKTTTVKAIDAFEGELEEAFSPQSVTVRLEHEVDVSRGDMLVHPSNRPRIARKLEADLVWLHERPLDTQKTYILKHTTQMVRVQVDTIDSKLNLQTLAYEPAAQLGLNDIARVQLTCRRALYFDAYDKNHETGAFILIDSLSNSTVGAGMIRRPEGEPDGEQELDVALKEVRAGSGLTPKTEVSPRERRERFGQSGAAVWLTGLPGSGRWSLAYALERRLFDLGRTAHVIDPTGESLASVAAAARACADAGLIAICAFESKLRSEREQVRAKVGAGRFFEVFVDTDVAVAKERRPDADLTGFEQPETPAVTVRLDLIRMHDVVDRVIAALDKAGQFEER
jgi:bifunctional enzyme CysN/CysC